MQLIWLGRKAFMPTFSIPIQHTEFVSLCGKKQQILFLPLHCNSGLRLIILGKELASSQGTAPTAGLNNSIEAMRPYMGTSAMSCKAQHPQLT